jgi:hypothetical protein
MPDFDIAPAVVERIGTVRAHQGKQLNDEITEAFPDNPDMAFVVAIGHAAVVFRRSPLHRADLLVRELSRGAHLRAACGRSSGNRTPSSRGSLADFGLARIVAPHQLNGTWLPTAGGFGCPASRFEARKNQARVAGDPEPPVHEASLSTARRAGNFPPGAIYSPCHEPGPASPRPPLSIGLHSARLRSCHSRLTQATIIRTAFEQRAELRRLFHHQHYDCS